MKKVENFNLYEVPIHDIIFTFTSNLDYETNKIYVVEQHTYPEEFLIITGERCSCYGFDETQWDAIIYTKEELEKVALGWKEYGHESELNTAGFILNYSKG